MHTEFELLFAQREGWVSFFLLSAGQTRASGKSELLTIKPLLNEALRVASEESDESNDEALLRPWIDLGIAMLGEDVFQIMRTNSPATLTLRIDSSINESFFDLFRLAPWEQVIASFSPSNEKQNLLTADPNYVTLLDVTIQSRDSYLVESVGGIEQVPPEMDFHSKLDDHEAVGTPFPVWFGTNRKLVTINGNVFEIPEAMEFERLHTGRCLVHIPKNHRRGELVSPWYRPRLGIRKDLLEIESIELVADLCAAIKSELEAGHGQNHLLFIHGFNNSFPDAILRAAQLGFDLGIDGATVAFSWPSRKLVPYLSRYTGDGERISGCRRAIENLIQSLGGLTGRLHVIAHSMGNRGFLSAWKTAFGVLKVNDGLKIGQVVFAAPDVFQATFHDETIGIDQYCERATLYASRRDKALGFSRLLSKTPRAGLLPPVLAVSGIDTIDIPFNGDLLGHTYFARAIPVLEDLAKMIHENLPPSKRPPLKLAESESGHWTFDLSETEIRLQSLV